MPVLALLRRLRHAYAPAVAAPLVAAGSLVLVEVSEGFDGGNALGALVADALAVTAIGFAALTLLVGGIGRLRAAGGGSVSALAEWFAVLAVLVAAVAHANAVESGSGLSGWTNFEPHIADQ